MTIAKPIADVFSIFENPMNLARITPPWLGFQVLTPPDQLRMRTGLIIDYRFRWLGLPMRWKTVIRSYNPPYEFVDEALQSPYACWIHRHQFRKAEHGTCVIDTVDYALPLGPLGRIAQAVMVRRNVISIFTHRQKVLSVYWDGEASIVSPAVTASPAQYEAPGALPPQGS
jgi:hypothetical protein